LKKFSWAAIAFEQDFFIGRVREIQEDGEKLDMEFVQKWDCRYRWPTRKDEAVVDKRFVLSLVEMGASGKHFVLHQPTEEDLRKEFKEYYQKFFAETEESNSADCKYVTTVSPLEPVKEFCPVDKKWRTKKCSELGIDLIHPITAQTENDDFQQTCLKS
jgi:hypothetical protein